MKMRKRRKLQSGKSFYESTARKKAAHDFSYFVVHMSAFVKTMLAAITEYERLFYEDIKIGVAD